MNFVSETVQVEVVGGGSRAQSMHLHLRMPAQSQNVMVSAGEGRGVHETFFFGGTTQGQLKINSKCQLSYVYH